MKHSPSPWKAVPQPGQTANHTYTHCVIDAAEDVIADTLTKADADLMAAAPDLLNACKAVIKKCYICEDHGEPPTAEMAADVLRAAIRRAEGGAA